MKDLYTYSTEKREIVSQPMLAIAFRVVNQNERDGINRRIQDLIGIRQFAENSALFCPPPGLPHTIDSEHVAHAYNRHADQAPGDDNKQRSIRFTDFLDIPDVVDPRNIKELAVTRGSPRIIYSKKIESDFLVVVEEIRRRAIVFKTMYRSKN